MLRNLSYELEKENSIFIIFGFSFDDEHIESIVKRSLINPKLQIYLHCFSENDYQKFRTKFKNFNNICYLRHEKNLNFTFFNNEIYCLEEEKGKNIDLDLDLDDIWGGLL